MPRSFRFKDRMELAGALPTLPLPLVAKPFSKEVDASFKTRYYGDLASLDRDYESDPDYAENTCSRSLHRARASALKCY